MAIDFPNSPVDGQIFTSGTKSWIYIDGTGWRNADAPAGPTGPTGPMGADGPTGPIGPTGPVSRAEVAEAPPISPSEGDLWFQSSTGRLHAYYDSFWVDISGPEGPTGPASEISPIDASTIIGLQVLS